MAPKSTNYDGSEGTSGLAARAAALGLPDPHADADADADGPVVPGVPPTPELDPTLGTSALNTGVTELETPDSAAPATDFLSRVAAHMASDGPAPARPGQGNEWAPVVDDHAGEPSSSASTGGPPAPSTDPGESGPSGSVETPPSSIPLGPPPLPWAAAPSISGAPGTSGAPGSPGTVTLDGQSFTEDELRAAIGVAARQSLMTPQQAALWSAFLAGQAQIVPVGQPPAPAPPSPSSFVDDDSGEYIDPRAAAEDARLQAALAQQQDQTRWLLQQEAARQNALEQTKVTSAFAMVRDKYQLPPSDVDPTLFQRLESAALPFAQTAFAQAPDHVDSSQIYEWAFEQAVWQTPQFREAIIASQVQSRVDEVLTSDELEQMRRRRANASSLAGSSQGSVPRSAPPARDPRTMTDAETRAAMAATLRATMNQ